MTPRFGRLLDEAIDVGVTVGWSRAHKHSDSPDDETIRDAIRQAVLNEIYERFAVPADADIE